MADIKYRNEKGNTAKWGRTLAAMVCSLSFAVTAAGCGKVEEPIPVDVSSTNMEELKEETSEDADAAGETVQPDAGNGNSESDTPENEQPDEESGSSTVQDDNGQQAQSVGGAELDGNVLSISQDSFVVSRVETWSEEGADFAAAPAPGYEAEEDRITVHVSQGCVWELKTVKNGGINPEDVSSRDGSHDDLQEGMTTHMKGSWQDDGSFLADSIVMMTFQ